jgi:preprotein translocase SecE subunit
MATAVKNTPDTTAPSLFDRPAAVSLVGVVYVIGCLGIVFKLLPYLFWDVLHLPDTNATNVVVAGLLMVAATGLLILGLRLLGPRAPHGARAGIFVGAVGALVALLLTRWASIWLEYWAMYGWFSPTVGIALTAVIGLALFAGAGYLFLHPKVEAFLARFEDQGWFSATTFKGQQGRLVRRGTIVGILAIAVAGVWTMYNHGTLRRLPANWTINVPFTGRTTIDTAALRADKDAVDKVRLEELRKKFPGDANPLVVSSYDLRDINRELSEYVKVTDAGDSDLTEGQVLKKSEVEKAIKDLRSSGTVDPSRLPKAEPITPVSGSETFSTIQLLPSVMYTLPILLLALSLWVAWRVVNYPVFADFLIATEAELNKVSWTTRRKLIQDTVVVLVTVALMAAYLFAMDQAWSHLLHWQPIRVIQFQEDANKANKTADQKPW